MTLLVFYTQNPDPILVFSPLDSFAIYVLGIIQTYQTYRAELIE